SPAITTFLLGFGFLAPVLGYGILGAVVVALLAAVYGTIRARETAHRRTVQVQAGNGGEDRWGPLALLLGAVVLRTWVHMGVNAFVPSTSFPTWAGLQPSRGPCFRATSCLAPWGAWRAAPWPTGWGGSPSSWRASWCRRCFSPSSPGCPTLGSSHWRPWPASLRSEERRVGEEERSRGCL